MTLHRGQLVLAETASGTRVEMYALGGATRGKDFAVVWLCSPQDYQRSERDGGEPDGMPWPLDAVYEVEPA